MRSKVALFCTLLATAHGWRVDFTARDINRGIQIETVCWRGDKETFVAVDYAQVMPSWTSVEMRRHDEVPKDSRCTVRAFVMASTDDPVFGSPDGDYVAESSEFVEQK